MRSWKIIGYSLNCPVNGAPASVQLNLDQNPNPDVNVEFASHEVALLALEILKMGGAIYWENGTISTGARPG